MDIRRITAVMTAAAVLTIGYQPPYAQAEETAAEILDITKFTVHDENLVHLGAGYLRGVEYLFDDQDKVPVSLENMKVDSDVWEATSRKNWTPNQQIEYGEASFYIDFGANYEIYGAALLDTNGTPVWTISDGEPFSWNEIAVQTMDTYNSWRAIKFDKPRLTRYMRFSAEKGLSSMAGTHR